MLFSKGIFMVVSFGRGINPAMSKPVFFRSPRIGSRRAAPQMSDSSRGAEGGTKGASGWSRAGGHRTGLGAGARSAPEARSRCWAGSPRRGGLRGARRVHAAPRVRRPSLLEAAGGRDDAAAHGRRRRRREPVTRPAPPHAPRVRPTRRCGCRTRWRLRFPRSRGPRSTSCSPW